MHPDSAAPSRDTSAGAPVFPVVGIGASAGGLEALQKLIPHLGTNGMAFVIVQHLASGRKSALSEILARWTDLPVVTIQEGQAVEPNHIYVTPPNVEVRVVGNQLRLEVVTSPEVPRRSIDNFLRSLALERGHAAIGVLLSGIGSDGTVGLRRLKEEGGITFVQDPATANQTGMPQAALDANVVDFCLSPEAIGDELMRLALHPYLARERASDALEEETLGRIFELLRSTYGMDFAGQEQGTVRRRIRRRMAVRKVETLPDYFAYLRNEPQEPALLYGELLIGATGFFRDRDLFETLASGVFPRLLEDRKADAPIRLWVAGCGTGEDVYSMAIALLEALGDRADERRVQIFATDIDEQSLGKARGGLFPRSIEQELSPDRLRRFFSLGDQGYRVNRLLRDMIVFARHSLTRDPPYSRLDLVSCRNVLVHMPPPLQQRIIRLLHYALRPGGILVLGPSEPVAGTAELFDPVDRGQRIFVKRSVSVGLPLADRHARSQVARGPGPGPGRLPSTIQKAAGSLVIERFAPPGVVVNAALETLRFWGRTGRFLEPVPGAASLNLLKLVRSELEPTLREAIDAAADTGVAASSAPVTIQDGSRVMVVSVDVQPLTTEAERGYVVLFQDRTPPAQPVGDQLPSSPGRDPRLEALERELEASRHSLQSTIEELQISNEELQSFNDELQSSNEELETSREELQAANEELETVNDELQDRMSQLGALRDDLDNVLRGVSGAVLLIGQDLRIRAFSRAAERLFNLLPSDPGRPLAYLRTVMPVLELEQMVAQVIGTVTPREERVRATDGSWYTMRIVPYKAADDVIRGALMEFLRAPAVNAPAAEELGGLATDLLASLLPQPVLALDDQLRVFWANRGFLALLQNGHDVVGRPLDELWDARLSQPQLWKRLEAMAGGGPPFSNFVVEHPFSPGASSMSFTARRLPGSAGHPPLTVLTMASLERGDDVGA